MRFLIELTLLSMWLRLKLNKNSYTKEEYADLTHLAYGWILFSLFVALSEDVTPTNLLEDILDHKIPRLFHALGVLREWEWGTLLVDQAVIRIVLFISVFLLFLALDYYFYLRTPTPNRITWYKGTPALPALFSVFFAVFMMFFIGYSSASTYSDESVANHIWINSKGFFDFCISQSWFLEKLTPAALMDNSVPVYFMEARSNDALIELAELARYRLFALDHFDIWRLSQNYTFFTDGLTYWLLWLTFSVMYVAYLTLVSEKSGMRSRGFVLISAVQLLVIFCFITMDLLHFFIAFEAVLIPLYYLIGIFGSRSERTRAAFFLVVFTLVGSIFLWYFVLYSTVVLGHTRVDDLAAAIARTDAGTQQILFWCLFLGFAFKVPLVPFHLWLTVAHVEAPTVGSILLAGLILKLGGYGMLRFTLLMFPAVAYSNISIIVTVCCVGYTFATILAIRQLDLKRFIAYTSIAHMNFGLAVLFTFKDVGYKAFCHTMVSHGIIASALFFLVGYIYAQTGVRDTVYTRSLASAVPFIAVFWFIFSMANVGMPLLSGFPGEFYGFIALAMTNRFALLAFGIGFYFTGAYTFLNLTRTLFGAPSSKLSHKDFFDLNLSELHAILYLAMWCLILGIAPDLLFNTIEIESRVLHTIPAPSLNVQHPAFPEDFRCIREIDALEIKNNPERSLMRLFPDHSRVVPGKFRTLQWVKEPYIEAFTPKYIQLDLSTPGLDRSNPLPTRAPLREGTVPHLNSWGTHLANRLPYPEVTRVDILDSQKNFESIAHIPGTTWSPGPVKVPVVVERPIIDELTECSYPYVPHVRDIMRIAFEQGPIAKEFYTKMEKQSNEMTAEYDNIPREEAPYMYTDNPTEEDLLCRARELHKRATRDDVYTYPRSLGASLHLMAPNGQYDREWPFLVHPVRKNNVSAMYLVKPTLDSRTPAEWSDLLTAHRDMLIGVASSLVQIHKRSDSISNVDFSKLQELDPAAGYGVFPATIEGDERKLISKNYFNMLRHLGVLGQFYSLDAKIALNHMSRLASHVHDLKKICLLLDKATPEYLDKLEQGRTHLAYIEAAAKLYPEIERKLYFMEVEKVLQQADQYDPVTRNAFIEKTIPQLRSTTNILKLSSATIRGMIALSRLDISQEDLYTYLTIPYVDSCAKMYDQLFVTRILPEVNHGLPPENWRDLETWSTYPNVGDPAWPEKKKFIADRLAGRPLSYSFGYNFLELYLKKQNWDVSRNMNFVFTPPEDRFKIPKYTVYPQYLMDALFAPKLPDKCLNFYDPHKTIQGDAWWKLSTVERIQCMLKLERSLKPAIDKLPPVEIVSENLGGANADKLVLGKEYLTDSGTPRKMTKAQEEYFRDELFKSVFPWYTGSGLTEDPKCRSFFPFHRDPKPAIGKLPPVEIVSENLGGANADKLVLGKEYLTDSGTPRKMTKAQEEYFRDELFKSVFPWYTGSGLTEDPKCRSFFPFHRDPKPAINSPAPAINQNTPPQNKKI